MTATDPTPRDLLVEARTLIASPEAWTQGAAARDADGEPVGVEHEDAVSWCSTGALNCAMYRHADSLQIPLPLERARDQAGTILTDTVRALTLGHSTSSHSTYHFRFVTVEYLWHPFHGRHVHARHVGRRDGIVVLADGDPHVSRTLPEWMCDPAACRSMTLGPPMVRADALSKLSETLAVLLSDRSTRTSSGSTKKESPGEATDITTANSTPTELGTTSSSGAPIDGAGAGSRPSSARSAGSGDRNAQRQGDNR